MDIVKDNISDIGKKEFLDLIKDSFPELFIREWGDGFKEYSARPATENYFFQKTDYFYKKSDLNFIHWTDLKSLLSILNYHEIRLYNLYNSNDKNEFRYSATALGLSEEEIKNAKKYYYTFSFCEKNQLNNPHLWEVYGKKYKGVAIEFSIINDPLQWNNYMISKVHYNIPENFHQFKQKRNLLEKKYNQKYKLDLNNLIGFNKSLDYNLENEVRIASYFPYTREDEILKYVKTDFRIDPITGNEITNYITLNLWENRDANSFKWTDQKYDRRTNLPKGYFKTHPQIKLNNIYFGSECGIGYTEFNRFKEKLENMILCNLGYRVQLEWDFITKT